MYEFSSVSLKFKKVIFNDFSYSFNDHGMYFISGPSGCGKSTLIKMLYFNHYKYSGDIYFNNENINNFNISTIEKIRSNIFYFSENNFCNKNKSLIDNIKFILGNDFDLKYAINILNKFKLDNKINQKYKTLSAGEKQRFVLSFAFMQNRKIILIDEMISNLDEYNYKLILNMLYELRNDRLIIIVDHLKLVSFDDVITIDFTNLKSNSYSFDYNFVCQNNVKKKKYNNSYSFKIIGINRASDVSVINKDVYNAFCYEYPIIRVSIPYSIDIKFDSLIQTIPLNNCYINPSLDENTIIAPTGMDGIAKILVDNDEIEVNAISAGISNIIISNDIAIKLSKYYDIFYASDYAYGIKASVQNEEEIADVILNKKGYLYFNDTSSYSLVMKYGKENSNIFLIIYFIALGLFVLIMSLDGFIFYKRNKDNISALRNFKFSNKKIIFSYSFIYFAFLIIIVGTLLFGFIYNRYVGLTYKNIVIYLLKFGFLYLLNYFIIFCLLIGKYILAISMINDKQKS